MRLDIKGIHEYQQNRFPYLLVDVAEEVVPGVSAKGYKNLSINDWFFWIIISLKILTCQACYKWMQWFSYVR